MLFIIKGESCFIIINIHKLCTFTLKEGFWLQICLIFNFNIFSICSIACKISFPQIRKQRGAFENCSNVPVPDYEQIPLLFSIEKA